MVHETILFEPVPEENFPKDKHIEIIGIKVGKTTFHNVYIPPASSCAAGYVPNITPYLPTDEGYFLSDINAHDPLWHSSIQDARGTLLSKVIGDSNLGVLNSETEFSDKTELEFSKLNPPNSVYKGEKAFQKIVNNISKKCIPMGRLKETIANIPTEAAVKMKTRDSLRSTDPLSPRLAELNSEIETLIRDHKQEKWRDLVGNIERKTDSGKLFKLIKNLNGQPKSKENTATNLRENTYLTP